MKHLIIFSVLLLSACGHSAPIQPWPCPGPANTTSGLHFFGDSITYGIGNTQNGVPWGFAQMMAQQLQMAIDDKAVPGTGITECGQLPSIQQSTIVSSQVYIFFAGTNDSHFQMGSDYETFKTGFAEAYKLLTINGARVRVAGPYYQKYDSLAQRAVVDTYNDFIQTTAGTDYVDLRAVVTPNMINDDTVHPGAAGHAAIAAAFAASL